MNYWNVYYTLWNCNLGSLVNYSCVGVYLAVCTSHSQYTCHIVTVWMALIPASTFWSCVFLFFFSFFFQFVIVDFVNCEQCIYVRFTVPQITLFSNFFIKNGSHNTIYTFKNYFVTVFSVSVSAKISSIQTQPNYVCH